ncbi:hypothetical protein ACFFQW_04420 [Umezawaea endophytica]|uniref:Uncharacterized protein n=1 Tax=Umezawaea endophytica TaxID=1654476 RepID=A0A9X3AE41_9PSEU|nr:hypothetical protein [Umezawaea endophytica]MCS7476386.1 hypothetical protein [Umezawaea endophytica]
MTDTSDESWPPEDLRNRVDFVMVQARHRIYLADDETGESGWRVDWGYPTERINPTMTAVLAVLMRRGAFTLGHRHTISLDGAEPVHAYELEITPSGHVLHDRVTYGNGLE